MTAWNSGNSPSSLTWVILASSSLSSTGNGSVIRLHESPSANSRFGSDPTVVCNEVMSSSRIESNGGFVTCANSCVK